MLKRFQFNQKCPTKSGKGAFYNGYHFPSKLLHVAEQLFARKVIELIVDEKRRGSVAGRRNCILDVFLTI